MNIFVWFTVIKALEGLRDVLMKGEKEYKEEAKQAKDEDVKQLFLRIGSLQGHIANQINNICELMKME